MAGGGVWIQVDPPVDQLVKVDTETGQPTVRIDGGRGIGTDGTDVWVALGPRGLAKIDPATGETLLAVPAYADYAAVGAGSVWTEHERGVGRWDTATGESLAAIPLDVAEVTELLFAHDSIWITAKEEGVVVRIDPASNEVVATIETGAGAHGMAADETGVWVTNYQGNSVSRIDAATNEVVATIDGVGSGVGIAAGGGAIWVSRQGVGISRIDPATNKAEPVVSLLGQWNYGLAYDDGGLWVTSVEKRLVYRVELEASGG
jgi:YVTN family beta-propeller protein